MARSDPRRRAIARAGLLLLLVALGAGGVPAAARADEDPFATYGGFNASARAGGVQVSYDVKGVLPLPPPLLEVTVPTSRASSATGPSSLAFGSLAYPGDLVGNLPSLVEQSAPGSGALVPPYPLATMASYPSGPATNRQDVGTTSATVEATASGAVASTSMGGSNVPGVVELGAITTSTRTGIEDGRIVARSHTQVASISLLFGLLRLDDVVTDVVAATDGSTGQSDGTTTIGGASVLGLPATIGPDGLTLGSDAVLGDVLGGVLGSTTASVNALLAAAGVRIALTPLDRSHDGAAATVDGTGLQIGLDFDGSGDGPLAQLLALIPADQLPGAAAPGLPVNTSPQALVNLLKETHVARIAVARASASVDASTAFAAGDDRAAPPTSVAGPVVPLGPEPGFGGPAFTTPLPVLASTPGAVTASARGGLVGGRAIGALLVVLAALALPAWGIASTRLMDAALADATPGCAAELEGPISRGGTRGAR
jgi:hypothetical protein